jgi:hypothetical protein
MPPRAAFREGSVSGMVARFLSYRRRGSVWHG